MAVTWITPPGELAVLTERNIITIPLNAVSNTGTVTYQLQAGTLPRGLRISNGAIVGSPTEVRKYTESRFVVRASDGADSKDRTFKLSVDGADDPVWVTPEGFLPVGEADAYFVLDNSYVNFQLEAEDPDENAGDVLEYYLLPNSGPLPPGLSLSKDGVISGFTDAILALAYNQNRSGSFDAQAYDVQPFDLAFQNQTGFDSYFYDNVIFDFSDDVEVPRRISRQYAFSVNVTDGVNDVTRLFKIYVVTEEFLQADNTLLQVDTNLFKADVTNNRTPLWITDSYLGKYRSNNYVTIFLDVYDPPSLPGTTVYILLDQNPDGSASELPPGLVLDTVTGDIAGSVPYQSAITESYTFTMLAVNFVNSFPNINFLLIGEWSSTRTYAVNELVNYRGNLYVCLLPHRNQTPADNTEFWEFAVSSKAKTFNIDIIGEIESAITWITPSDRGTIKPNQPSRIYIEAQSLLYGGRIAYDFISGSLPPGLTFISTGNIIGKVKQFADTNGPGLTRFFDSDSALQDSSGSRTFNTTFDGEVTSFDKKFTFTVRARDYANASESLRTFIITVISESTQTFANLYAISLQKKSKRLAWFNFITDASIFEPVNLYRYGDPNFGIQSELRLLIYAGIESTEAVKYVQALSRNHYRKRFRFGDLKVAKAKDPTTQETVYEVIYVQIVDEYESNGKNISEVIELRDNINSNVLVSYDSIKVDSDIPFASDRDHQRIFPNSVKNMRRRLESVGDRDREFLPLWMRSIQDGSISETGYVKALVLFYCDPGKSTEILAKIRAANFNFKSIDFEADRYIIDIIDGVIQDKYIAFPQRDILNKSINIV